MNKKQLIKLLNDHDDHNQLRDVISQVAQKLIACGINRTVPIDVIVNKPNLSQELKIIRELLELKESSDNLLLQAIVDFYFSKVKETLGQKSN